METLEHEKFQGAQELAKIGVAIAQGKATLEGLKKGEGEFIKAREEKALAAVQSALEQSRDLLTEIGQNHDALTRYRTEIEGFLDDVRSLLEAVKEIKEAFDTGTKAVLEDIERRQTQLDLTLIEVRKEKSLVEGAIKDMQVKRQQIRDEARKLRDDKAEWERTKKELEDKK